MENESQFKNQENAVIKIWDKRYSETETYRKQKVKDGSVFDFFEKYNDEVKAGPSLDLGCGNGRHLRHMARMGLDTYGIDISSESLKQLKEDFKEEDLMANIQQSSFYNLPYKDEKFNSIVSHNSLQHNDWDGAKKSFAEVGRVLKDSGLFSLTVISTNCDRPQQVNDISSKEEGTTFIPYEGRKAGIKSSSLFRRRAGGIGTRKWTKNN